MKFSPCKKIEFFNLASNLKLGTMADTQNYNMIIVDTIKAGVISMASQYFKDDTLNRFNYEAVITFLKLNENKIAHGIKKIFEQYKFEDKSDFEEEKDSDLMIELYGIFEMCLILPIKNACIKYLNCRFIKSRVINIVSEMYSQEHPECEDEEVAHFLKVNEKEINTIGKKCFEEIFEESDCNEAGLNSVIIENYHTLVQA